MTSDPPTETDRAPSGDTASPGQGVPPEELGFTGCVEELDLIVRRLETDAIDVDHLATAVERAATLVEWCRARLGDTRLRLDEVLPRLEDEGAGNAAPGAPGDASAGGHDAGG